MNPISVFISHSWSYSGHYDTLSDWIFERTWNSNGTTINFIDQSVPKEDPIHNANSKAELRSAIFGRIQLSNVVVIPTGMYANYSNWIQEEIDGAETYSIPILAVNPWGQERTSSNVRDAAVNQVGWTAESVIQGIWQLVT